MIHRGVNNCAVHYAPLNAVKKKYAAPSSEENENIKMFYEYARRRTLVRGRSATKV